MVDLETQRLEIQANLDADRTPEERNAWGQFATPSALAAQVVEEALRYLGNVPITFLDPGVGSGAFFSALLRSAGPGQIASALGVELDHRFATAATNLWGRHGLEVLNADFTRLTAPSGGWANLVIANPPYVRHHHLDGDTKAYLQRRVKRTLGIDTSGLAGLYVYFMLLAHDWMRDDAVAAWLVPSEWMSVNYGTALRRYLTEHVTVVRLHQFDAVDVQFGDALVSSSLVFFRKRRPRAESKIRITYGGRLDDPSVEITATLGTLRSANKWSAYIQRARDGQKAGPTRVVIGDLFAIRRGIATGCNPFFVRPLSEWDKLGVSRELLRPVLPSSRQLDSSVIEARQDGYPDLDDPLGLLDCALPPEELRVRHPKAWEYLHSAEGERVRKTYLASRRRPWYSQESRAPAPILSTYMGRGRNGSTPFRFFANRSKAIATNGYLMLYPRGPVATHLAANPKDDERLASLLQEIAAGTYRTHGREYGGGLHKLEPSELSTLPADLIVEELRLPVEASPQLELATM